MYRPGNTGTEYDTKKHGFTPFPNDPVTCVNCERSFTDPIHCNVGEDAAEHGLSYPLHCNSLQLNGPTLFYLDETGTPIQLGLNDQQVQMILDDFNAPDQQQDMSGELVQALKPPLTVGGGS